MTGVQRFSRGTLPATPWKNGGGVTREIVAGPPGAPLHAFGWRISIATIAASGPFSVFPGIDRSIMLLDGDGVRLATADGRINHRLDTPLRPFAFSGDEAIDCTLAGGVSTDFNVMTRRGQWRAELQVLERDTQIPPSQGGVLLALAGTWGLDAQSCGPGEGLHWTDASAGWQARADSAEARLLVVRIERT